MPKEHLNILHLSDIHFSRKNETDQRLVLDAFLGDLEKISKSSRRPSLVIITGDCVYNPDEEGIFDAVSDELILPIQQTLNLNSSKIVLCPGNHDAHRSIIKKHNAFESTLEEIFRRRQDANSFYVGDQSPAYLHEKFLQYYEFAAEYGSQNIVKQNIFFTNYYYEDLDLLVTSFNSALLSQAGLNDVSDEGKLAFPEAALIEAARSDLSPNKRIVCCHHPIHWLQEWSANEINQSISTNYDAFLFGHVHDPQPHQITSPSGSSYVSQAGALYSDRKRYYNGYSVISLARDNNFAQSHFRSYFEKRRAFDAGTDITPDGNFHSSTDAKEYWGQRPTIIATDVLRDWIAKAVKPSLSKSLNEGFSEKPLSEIFVPPTVLPMEIMVEDPDAKTPASANGEMDFSGLVESRTNYIVFGRKEFGKTSFLKQVALECMNASSPLAPAILDFEDVKVGGNRIVSAIRSQLPDTSQLGFSIQDILSSGGILLLIDDVDFQDARRIAELKKFVSTFPKTRFIFSTIEKPNNRLAQIPELDFAVEFDIVSLKEFSRHKMRQLVTKWCTGDAAQNSDKILNQVVADMANINVPFTAANGTIILVVLEARSNFRPINRAVLIERFIEVLLDKFADEEVARGTFDYTNKIVYLAEVARQMDEQENFTLDYEDLHSLTREYFDRIGFNHDISRIIQSFVQARIFSLVGNKVRFRYKAFVEFFLGQQIQTDPKFKSKVLSAENYLNYPSEIDYYSALTRNDADLLELVGNRFKKLTEKFLEDSEWEPDLNAFNNLQALTKGSETIHDQIGKAISAQQPSDEERDALLESQVPQHTDKSQEIQRAKSFNVGEQWINCLLLYSRILKNTEHVNADCKQKHLSAILKGWGLFTITVLYIIPILASKRVASHNGMSVHILAPKEMSEVDLARNIYMHTPRAVSSLIYEYLGTEKLARTLLEKETNEPAITTFFRRALYFDLQLSEFVTQMKHLESELNKHGYLYEAMMWKLFETFQLKHLPKHQLSDVTQLIATCAAELKGGTKSQKKNSRAKQLHKLEQRLLIRQIRENSRK